MRLPWKRRPAAEPSHAAQAAAIGAHRCPYREVLEELIVFLRRDVGDHSVSARMVLQKIGADVPDPKADPLTGCLPVTAEGPAPEGPVPGAGPAADPRN